MAYSGSVSTLAASPISTFVRPYGPCTQVDIGLAARVDTRPRTPPSVGFVYLSFVILSLNHVEVTSTCKSGQYKRKIYKKQFFLYTSNHISTRFINITMPIFITPIFHYNVKLLGWGLELGLTPNASISRCRYQHVGI